MLLLLGCLTTGLFCSQVGAVEVISHALVAEAQLPKAQLRRIYTMRQIRWSDDSAITVFVLPSQNKLHVNFSKERLQIFPYQLNRIWHKLTYSGLGVAPIIVNSEQALIQAVMTTPGAIGYADKRVLTKFISQELAKSEKTSHQQGINRRENTLNALTTDNNTMNVTGKKDQRSKGVVHVIDIKG